MNILQQYDYIIAGTGCAGLSLAVHMIHSGKFQDKKILLIDKVAKNKNDRTWCFWEKEPGLFESIVHHRWEKAWFHGENFSKLLTIEPFQYKLIRGIDFYNYSLGLIRQSPNFEIRSGEVKNLISNEDETSLIVGDEKYSTKYIFNSILFEKPKLKKGENYFLQHFKGWIIETSNDVFEPGEATLMDLRVEQQNGVTFAYVMPFSPRRALVEYTLFSEKILEQKEYEDGLKNYISQFIGTDSYKVVEEEFGVIPMTDHLFPASQHHIINIGTAGGQTKASSGYTFRFIQEHSAAIVERLTKNESPVIQSSPSRFHFYDKVLLEVLSQKKISGRRVFTALFKKNKPQQVLRFMDNKSSIAEELKIISSLPTLPFLKAAVKQI